MTRCGVPDNLLAIESENRIGQRPGLEQVAPGRPEFGLQQLAHDRTLERETHDLRLGQRRSRNRLSDCGDRQRRQQRAQPCNTPRTGTFHRCSRRRSAGEQARQAGRDAAVQSRLAPLRNTNGLTFRFVDGTNGCIPQKPTRDQRGADCGARPRRVVAADVREDRRRPPVRPPPATAVRRSEQGELNRHSNR